MEEGIYRSTLRQFLVSLFSLFLLILIGVSGYRWLERMDYVDALFMTIITISTVGFSEVKPLSPTGKIFTIGMIVAGAGVVAFTLTRAAEYILSGDLRNHIEHRRRTRMLTKLKNHTIVCGYGRVGRHVVQELKAEGLPFVVIDPNVETINRLHDEGGVGVLGSAATEHILKEAGIDRALGLVVAANSDAENVFIVLTARSLREDINIVARADQEETEAKLLRAGANRVLLPYGITGRRMVTMLVRPDVADFLDEVSRASGLELLLEQVHLKAGSPLVGQTLAQAQLGNRLGINVVACKLPGGELNTKPGADTLLLAESDIIAIGTRDELLALKRLAEGER